MCCLPILLKLVETADHAKLFIFPSRLFAGERRREERLQESRKHHLGTTLIYHVVGPANERCFVLGSGPSWRVSFDCSPSRTTTAKPRAVGAFSRNFLGVFSEFSGYGISDFCLANRRRSWKWSKIGYALRILCLSRTTTANLENHNCQPRVRSVHSRGIFLEFSASALRRRLFFSFLFFAPLRRSCLKARR